MVPFTLRYMGPRNTCGERCLHGTGDRRGQDTQAAMETGALACALFSTWYTQLVALEMLHLRRAYRRLHPVHQSVVLLRLPSDMREEGEAAHAYESIARVRGTHACMLLREASARTS